MDERLTQLLARLREQFAPDSGPDEVEAYLSSQGYDRRQIGEILTLLFTDPTTPASPSQPVASAPMTIRVLGPHERNRFAPDAWGHLLALSGAGLVSPLELEYIIERALTHYDGRIALDDLRALLDGAGYDEGSTSGEQPTVH